MLIGNYNVLQKSCGRFTSGSSLSDDRAAFGKNGALRNRYNGWAGLDHKTAVPAGYLPGYTWSWPQKTGGIGSFRNAVGSGGVTAGNLAGGKNAVADLAGAGDVTSAIGSLIVSAVAALVGAGDITNASVLAALLASADLAGSGEVSAAALTAKAYIDAALDGSGDLDATTAALGELSADIVLTGELLTASNVGSAVWDTLLEAGFTASQVMRIIAACAAGKTSGGPGSPVFRNLADTQDQVSGIANASGNRTSMTYGG